MLMSMTRRNSAHHRRPRRTLAAAFLTSFLIFTGLAPGGASADHALRRVRVPIAATSVAAGVVDITTQLGTRGTAAGTGMVIDPSGQILTNNHVVEGGTNIEVTVPGVGMYDATVVGSNADQDVALLAISGAPSLVSADLGDSSHVAVGDAVSAVGNAGGEGGAPTVSSGRVTGLHQDITTVDDNGMQTEHLKEMIRTDARIVPGDSGGPLVDEEGQVIGMDTAADMSHSRSGAQGYAIPINRAISVVRRFLGSGDGSGGPKTPLWPALLLPAPAALSRRSSR